MLFDFYPQQYREQLQASLQGLQLSAQSGNTRSDQPVMQMLAALMQSVDIMERADADRGRGGALSATEAGEIADYVFNLLEQLSIQAANRGMQRDMLQLQRLALPVVVWLAQYDGEIRKLDILVNALASYANELTESSRLEELAALAAEIVRMTAENIRRDLDNSDPGRPWRVLNLNWGIIATRSHNVQLMQSTFDHMLKNIPLDAPHFFREGMQQMAIINYPQSVRDVMEKYYREYADRSHRH